MPCTVPSSPGTPWSALNTTSGFTSCNRSATSRSMSIRVTRWPRSSSALATPSPLVSDTGRSADQPPIRTATWSLGRRLMRSSPARGGGPLREAVWWRGPVRRKPPQSALRADSSPGGGASCKRKFSPPPHPLDFPFEAHALALGHAAADFFAEAFDVRAGRLACVDEEIGMFLTDLRTAQLKPATSGGVDQAPGFVPRGVLEGRAAGLGPQRLRFFACCGDAVHFRADRLGIAPRAAKAGRDDDRAFGQRRVAV